MVLNAFSLRLNIKCIRRLKAWLENYDQYFTHAHTRAFEKHSQTLNAYGPTEATCCSVEGDVGNKRVKPTERERFVQRKTEHPARLRPSPPPGAQAAPTEGKACLTARARALTERTWWGTPERRR